MRVLLLLALWGAPAFAADSNSPYIDAIREELKQEAQEQGTQPSNPQGYTDKMQQQIRKRDEEQARELGEPAPGSKTFMDQLKEEDPSLKRPDNGSTGYSERLLKTLPPKKQGGAIEAFLKGESALKARKEGLVTGAFGFKMGASVLRDIQGGDRQLRPFDEVYGEGWAPDLTFFYEYQPWHSETWGNFGLMGSAGLAFFNGFGRFKFQLINAATDEAFPIESQTRFLFFQVPVMVGLNYRMNLFKVLKPFVMAGPMGIFFFESRNDDKSGGRGLSKAFLISGGVSIPLDWLSATSSWDLYRAYGIKQYYLTIDYTKITTIASDVNFDVSGVSVGLTFEF